MRNNENKREISYFISLPTEDILIVYKWVHILLGLILYFVEEKRSINAIKPIYNSRKDLKYF
jgi:hypothetical protein